MNIDAYLHQVHSANARLKDVMDCVKEVVSEGIEKKIEEIRRVILFDKKLATAHVWNVDKFVEEESKAVSQQGRRVHEMVKEVENALQVMEEQNYFSELLIFFVVIWLKSSRQVHPFDIFWNAFGFIVGFWKQFISIRVLNNYLVSHTSTFSA